MPESPAPAMAEAIQEPFLEPESDLPRKRRGAQALGEANGEGAQGKKPPRRRRSRVGSALGEGAGGVEPDGAAPGALASDPAAPPNAGDVVSESAIGQKKRTRRARKPAEPREAATPAAGATLEAAAPPVAGVTEPPPAAVPVSGAPAPELALGSPGSGAAAPAGSNRSGEPRPRGPKHGHREGPPPGGAQRQPGQPGQGRRRRRRRGRGGGGGGQLLAGQALNPQLEAQLQSFSGVLELDDRGFGKLRRVDRNFHPTDQDPEVPKQLVDRHRLRPGVLVEGQVLVRGGKPTVLRVDRVEGVPPEEAANRLAFQNLTVVDPDRRIQLETTSGELLTRVIDIITPVGFGQRGLIVAAPKTGKTIILQKMAKAVLTNHPKAHLMVLLIDERPEEVTDFRRSVGADVFASSSDRPADEHLALAEIVMERARRLVEDGEDVVVLLDSITRLARAYNKEIESSGRTMSGGVDSRALEKPKRIFGAARNTEEAGSLTIIGTALIDTGSRMDEVIFEEFKGTGNMELVLDRQLADRRLWPAINVNNSGTRKEEKLFSVHENEKIRKLRAYLSSQRPVEAMEKLLQRLKDFRSNAEFFEAL